MSGDILNYGVNVENKEDSGFTESFKKTIIIDDNTKMRLIKMKRTPNLNIDEKQLNNPISENIDKKD